jgi:GH15 family glucan-1,4-alpha-glucosidase
MTTTRYAIAAARMPPMAGSAPERDALSPARFVRSRPNYLPIAEHGLIGDQRSVALVGTDGTIDWYCPEQFDAPSVFAAILDRKRGGFFRIAPSPAPTNTKQLYLPDTNVLITRFLSPAGVAEVHDFMPLDGDTQGLIRRVVGISGAVPFRLELVPRFNFARDAHRARRTTNGARFQSTNAALAFGAGDEHLRISRGDVTTEFTVAAGETRGFLLRSGDDDSPLSPEHSDALEQQTVSAWRDWLSQSTYTGRWRERVNRSALTLALLTYAPSGAIIAAPTTSLPEQIGGTRNWDYRYAWLRDFAFSQHSLSRLGFVHEARRANSFARSVPMNPPGADGTKRLRPLYRVANREHVTEEVLSHLEGYRGSWPVRVGNGAADQLQLDVYGELIDSIYVYERRALEGHGQMLSYDEWLSIVRHVDWLCQHWDEPDEGIWEVRNGPRRFTFSRLMSWVAFDRATRIARARSLPADIAGWTLERDRVFSWIHERGWSEQRRAFVQHDATEDLDASLLLMPLVHFIAPTDPRWLSTLDAITDALVRDSLVFRYDHVSSPDGVDGEEGTFSMCTFWYVECLARAGRLDEAQLVFEKMHTYANHLGLYSEQIGINGELLGNFPQAFTHLALISAAVGIDRQLTRRPTVPAVEPAVGHAPLLRRVTPTSARVIIPDAGRPDGSFG